VGTSTRINCCSDAESRTVCELCPLDGVKQQLDAHIPHQFTLMASRSQLVTHLHYNHFVENGQYMDSIYFVRGNTEFVLLAPGTLLNIFICLLIRLELREK